MSNTLATGELTNTRNMDVARSATSGDAPTPPNPKATFPGLPPELRDLIYHEVWLQSGCLYFSSNLCRDNVSYGNSAIPWQKGLPLWLLTSKTVFHEGLTQLFRKGTWTCEGKCDLNPIRGDVFSAASFASRYTLHAKKEKGTREFPAIKYGIIAPAAGQVFYRFGTRLQHVWLEFEQNLPASQDHVQDRKWRLDLSCLDDLRLSLMSLTVSCYAKRYGSLDCDTVAPGLVGAYEREVRRVAGRLVGAEANVEVKQKVGVYERFHDIFYRLVETYLSIRVRCQRRGIV